MAKARVKIEDATLFKGSIDNQLDRLYEVDKYLCEFEKEALNKIASEKEKLIRALEEISNTRKVAEEKREKIERDIERVEEQLAVTTHYIPEVQDSGDDSPPVVVWVRNPEYDRLEAELERHRGRLAELESAVGELDMLEVKAQNEYRELEKAEIEIEGAVKQARREIDAWFGNGYRAQDLLDEIIEVLNNYLSATISGYAGTSAPSIGAGVVASTAPAPTIKTAGIPKAIKDKYKNDLLARSEYKDTIDKSIMERKWEKITPEVNEKMRMGFSSSKQSLISDWEKANNRSWPTYKQDVYTSTGKLIRRKGDKYDAHHIQPLTLGGENTAQNITPLHALEHFDKQGIHAPTSPFGQMI